MTVVAIPYQHELEYKHVRTHHTIELALRDQEV